jgi:hypothetical protein
MPNRFVLKISDSAIGAGKGIAITKDPKYAQLMTRFMQEQSASKVDKLGLKVAGKTGTPERIVRQQRINDGWYTFFAPKANGAGHIVVCVRIEDAKGSSVAVRMAGKHVIPKLLELGYVKSFETEEPGPRKTDNKKQIVFSRVDFDNNKSISQCYFYSLAPKREIEVE